MPGARSDHEGERMAAPVQWDGCKINGEGTDVGVVISPRRQVEERDVLVERGFILFEGLEMATFLS